MAQKGSMNDIDLMVWAYYLQLQDRIDEAVKVFKRVNPDNLAKTGDLQIQYDYMNVYLDFFTGKEENFKIAREVSKSYEEYPVIAWRALFLEVLDQLNEIDGDTADYEHLEDEDMAKKRKQKQAVSTEPVLQA